MIDTLYKEEILDHYRDPQNFGEMHVCDISSRQLNPFCGDEISIALKFDAETVSDIKFNGKGCAIAIASASILTEHAKGKTKSQLLNISEENMIALLGVEVSDTRKKCALLALSVLKDCLQ